MKECSSCHLELDEASFEKYRQMCKKCIYEKKKERSAGKYRTDAPHVDACVKCDIPFDPLLFPWRSDNGTWRNICHRCRTPASISVKYKATKREEDEEAWKAKQREYMRQYRKDRKEKKLSN